MVTWNKQVVRGDTFNGVQFEVIVNGIPKNLSGAQIKIQFAERDKTGAIVKNISVGSGITVLDAPNGVFRIDPFLVDFKVGKTFYDVQITDISGVVKTYIEGYFNVLQDVTI